MATSITGVSMGFGELFLILLLGIFLVGGVATGIELRERKNKQIKQGMENAKQLVSVPRCLKCQKEVDPRLGDVYDHNAWFCYPCWKEFYL